MKSSKKNFHPTEKSVKLSKFLIKLATNENDVVLDPFMGSGTTGVACNETKRDFIGFEIDEKFYKISEERLKIF